MTCQVSDQLIPVARQRSKPTAERTGKAKANVAIAQMVSCWAPAAAWYSKYRR